MSSLADDVRKYCTDHYVIPARNAGQTSIRVNVGEVHKAMRYSQRLPLVASALTAMRFRKANRLKLVGIEGPGQSTTTTLVFELE